MTSSPTASFDQTGAPVNTYLIYVVLDTSESMRRPRRDTPQLGSPLQHFVRLIPQMLRELADHPVTNSLASVSVVAFNDEPEVLRQMSPLHQAAPIRQPKQGYGTDYAAVLEFLVAQHAKNVRAVQLNRLRDDFGIGIARPWIFFITDGRPFAEEANQPTSAWIGHRNTLTEPPLGARIVALGLPGAEPETLWRLSTGQANGMRNAFIADQATNPAELTSSVIAAIQRSISTSTSTGHLAIRTPNGMRRVDGPYGD